MIPTSWQDLAMNILPLVVSSVTAYYSYKLGKAKLDRETARDHFDRLTAEIKMQDQQIMELKKALLLCDSEKQQREAEHDR